MRYYIDNKLAFWGATFAFLGSLLVTLDRISYFQPHLSNIGPWKKIGLALQKLDVMEAKLKDSQMVGIIQEKDEGFTELARVIAMNRPDLLQKKIITIVKNRPGTIADQPISVIHVVTADAPDNGKSVVFETGLMQWISTYRTEWFLYRGFTLVSLGFLLGVFSRIKGKEEKAISQPTEASTPPIPLGDVSEGAAKKPLPSESGNI